MVSGSTEGHLAVWDLERQELNNTIHHAHHSTVATSHFLASQPLLFTAGADNAIKIWVFDGPGWFFLFSFGTCLFISPVLFFIGKS